MPLQVSAHSQGREACAPHAALPPGPGGLCPTQPCLWGRGACAPSSPVSGVGGPVPHAALPLGTGGLPSTPVPAGQRVSTLTSRAWDLPGRGAGGGRPALAPAGCAHPAPLLPKEPTGHRRSKRPRPPSFSAHGGNRSRADPGVCPAPSHPQLCLVPLRNPSPPRLPQRAGPGGRLLCHVR